MTNMALRSVDKAFDSDPERSHTLPARYYYDPEVYEREKAAIFFRSWIFVAHVSQLAEPGRYVTEQIHEQHVIVMRGKDGQLRGFYNVCQHRGHELLAGSGCVRAIVCPYHGWSYETDGRLRHARNTEALPGFKHCEFSLKQVAVEEFCGFVFVNLDVEAKPLAQQVGDLEQEIRRFVPALDQVQFVHRNDYSVASNWKVLIDNFLECYHCHIAHKAFVDLVDMESYRSKACGVYSSHIAMGPVATDSIAYRCSASNGDFSYAGWFLWPNLTIWVMPGEPNISLLKINPHTPEHSLESLDWYVVGDAPSAEMREAMTYLDDVLQPEDIGLCESVQRGLHSFGYNQGRFVVDTERSQLSEHAVHHFQQMVLDALAT